MIPEEYTKVDPRNNQPGIGFTDVMGYQLNLPGHDRHTEPWQNLWIRRACNTDVKRNDTCGKNSRYYKFEIKKKYGDKPRRDLWKPKPKGDFKTEKTVKKGIDLKNRLKEVRNQPEENEIVVVERDNSVEDPEQEQQQANQDQNQDDNQSGERVIKLNEENGE